MSRQSLHFNPLVRLSVPRCLRLTCSIVSMYRVMPPGAKDGEEGGAEERGPNETNYVEWMKVVRGPDTPAGAERLDCE